jgi:hypothetical protein
MLALVVAWSLAAVVSSASSPPTAPSPSLSPALAPRLTTSVTPPLLRGVAKNGAAIVAVPSTSPLTLVALEVTSPDPGWCVGLESALPAMQAAAQASAGPEALVEVSARPSSVSLVVTMPSSSTERALKAADAALRVRSAGPRATAASTSTPCLPADREAASRALIARVSAAEVAIAVIGPGPGPELLRRAQAAIRAPLSTGGGSRLEAAARSIVASDDTAPHHEVPVTTMRARAALLVLAAHAGFDVHPRAASCIVGVSASALAVLRNLQAAPMPLSVVAAHARSRRFELAAGLADPVVVVSTLAREARSADDTWALLDALAIVDDADVAAMVVRVLEVLP